MNHIKKSNKPRKIYVISSTTISGKTYYWAGPINWWVSDPYKALHFDTEEDAKIEIHICREVFRRPSYLMKYYPRPEIVFYLED